jgi:hypothetical protein
VKEAYENVLLDISIVRSFTDKNFHSVRRKKMLLKVPPLILMTTMIVHHKSPQLKGDRRVKLVKHENHPHHPTEIPTRNRRKVSGWIPHRRAMIAHPIATLTSEIVKGRITVEKELPRSPKRKGHLKPHRTRRRRSRSSSPLP